MLSPNQFAFRFRGWAIAAGILGVLVLLYALLIENAVLLGLLFFVWVFGLFVVVYVAYLFYHFVHSVSRIADALESGDRDSTADGSSDAGEP